MISISTLLLPILTPPLSVLATTALLGYTVITIPPNEVLKRAAMFPLILVPIVNTIITAPAAGPVPFWNLYVGVLYGTFMVLDVFCTLFVYRVGYDKLEGEKEEEDSIQRKIRFSFDLVINKRRIGHADQVQGVPVFDLRDPEYVPSNRQFLIYRTVRFVLLYLFLDVITVLELEDTEIKCAVGKEYILSRVLNGEMTGPEFGELVGMVLGFGAGGIVGLVGCYDLVSVLAVGLAGMEVKDWPPLFGRLGEAYSIRRFWGVFWHQQLRRMLTGTTGFVVHDLLRLSRVQSTSKSRDRTRLGLLTARYAKLLLALAISGVIHLNNNRIQAIPLREFGIVWFFLWQGVGMVIEDAVQSVYRYFFVPQKERSLATAQRGQPERRRLAVWIRALGFIWLASFMVLVAPLTLFPTMRYGGPGKLVPFSIVRWVMKIAMEG